MLTIKNALAIMFVGFAFTGSANAQSETFKLGMEATEMLSMSVIHLREQYCGGELTEGNQDAKNISLSAV